MIELIPAIDLIDGCCVRLTQGDYAEKKVYEQNPVDMAKMYADCVLQAGMPSQSSTPIVRCGI